MAKLTVLRVSEEGKQAAKTIWLDAAGQIVKTNFNAGTWFHYSQKDVEGIKELSALLLDLAHDTQALVVRGDLAKGKDPKEKVRRIGVKGHGDAGFFQSSLQGQPWILLDFDGISTPSAISFIANPLQGIEYLVSLLPLYFHNASHHYHVSSSAGLDGGKTIRAHLWYWLDHPVTDEHLRVWAKSVNSSGKLIDDSLFGAVHPHYTADPIFKAVPDPFPKNRSGFVKGKSDAVVFPAISVQKFTCSSSTDGLTPTEAFQHYLLAVGDHDGGMGFHEPLMMASFHYVLENGIDGTDKAALKQKLKEAIAQANQSNHSQSDIIQKASDAHLDSLIDGAIVKIGAKAKTGKIEGLEPHYQQFNVLSVKKGENQLRELVKSFFDTPRNMGIKAPAGLGKTTEVIAKLSGLWMMDKKVDIYVPTHALADEVAGKLKYHPFKKPSFHFQSSAPTGILWQVIRGRNYEAEDGSTLCQKYQVAATLSAKGLSVYPNLCNAGNTFCEHFDECGYIQQFSGEYDVRVYPHSYLRLDRGYLDKDIPDWAVIDESFYPTMLAGINAAAKPISLHQIKSAPWPESLITALVLAPGDKPLLSYLRQQIGEDQLIAIIDDAAEKTQTQKFHSIIGLSPKVQLAAATSLPEQLHLGRLLDTLKTELLTNRDEAHGIFIDGDGIWLRYRKPIHRLLGEKDGKAFKIPTLAIDADLADAVHRQFFPDFEYHRIDVNRRCHVTQCYSTNNNTTSMTFDAGGDKKIEEIQSVIDRVSMTKNVLVLGPQSVTGNISSGIKSKVSVPECSALAHFNSIRGIDAFKDMEAVLVIGRNQPSVSGVENIARALWFDSEEPLKLNVKDFSLDPRGYRTSSGYLVGVNVNVHPDPRIQILLELIRECETLQGIDRLRLIHGDKKPVFLFSNLVLDITVDHLISWKELVAGTTKLSEVWEQLDGVMPLTPDWLSEKFSTIFPNEGSAKEHLKIIGKQVGAISNSISISEVTHLAMYQYTLSAQSGSPRKCVSMWPKKETKQKLEVLMGKPVEKIEIVSAL